MGTVSDPVQSSSGWHIIWVMGHELRPLTDDEYSQLRQDEFDKWLKGLSTSDQVKTLDTWLQNLPEEPKLPAYLAGT